MELEKMIGDRGMFGSFWESLEKKDYVIYYGFMTYFINFKNCNNFF